MRKITIDGKTFDSLTEACRYYNVENHYSIIRYRLRNGFTPEEAFGTKGFKNTGKKGVKIILEGKTFISRTEACKYYGLNRDKVKMRLRRGWSLEEAFELADRNTYRKTAHEIELNGKKFKSKAAACRYYNLDRQLVYSRLNLGWSLEEAYGLKNRKITKGEQIIVEEKIFRSLYAACKYYNKEYSKTYKRIKIIGWTPEEAFELVPREKKLKER